MPSGAPCFLDAAQVHGAVAGNAHGEDLALAGGGDDGAEEALEGLRSLQGALELLGVRLVHALDESLDGCGFGGIHDDCRRGGLGDLDSSGTTVVTASTFLCVAAGRTHEGVLTDGGRVQELLTREPPIAPDCAVTMTISRPRRLKMRWYAAR